MKLQLNVITPVKTVLSEEVDQITLPTQNGEITILPNHAPLISKINSGEMIIRKNQKPSFFAITGGFIEVSKNNVTILADYAVRAENIEVAKAREAQERAQNSMKQKGSARDFTVAEADLRRALLELHVAKRQKRSTPS